MMTCCDGTGRAVDLGVVTEPLRASLSPPGKSEGLSETRSPAAPAHLSQSRHPGGVLVGELVPPGLGHILQSLQPSQSAQVSPEAGVSGSWMAMGCPVVMPSSTLATCLRRTFQCHYSCPHKRGFLLTDVTCVPLHGYQSSGP